MSQTGPGCPACDFSGRTTLDGATPASCFGAVPCGACSPWSHPVGFPDAALRAKASEIRKAGDLDLRMVAWAARLLVYADEVDACPPSTGRCAS